MDRMACVDIRALPLQLLLRNHPDWQHRPVVVVDRDKALGLILWANEEAYNRRIFPGMRYAAGLALANELRGGVVPEEDVAAAVDEITQRLWTFSPNIEPSTHEAGVFWLDASGLQHVFPSLERWAECICTGLRELRFEAVVVVGFSHFGCYAAAKSTQRNLVLPDPETERAYVRRIPIERLALDPNLRDTLFKLGIQTVGEFMDLPAGGIRKRFGPDAAHWHQLARGDMWAPLAPQRLFEPIEGRVVLDYPIADVDPLLAKLGGLVESFLIELAARHELLAAFHFTLALDGRSAYQEDIAPATPTRDAHQIIQLLRLRLENLALSAGVVDIRARAEGVAAHERQLGLIPEGGHAAEAAHEALARVRAQLGNQTIVRACLHEGHLPEARYAWETLQHIPAPKPRDVALRPLIRRIYTPPVPLPPRGRREPDGWLIAGLNQGPVDEVIGPHLISGGWWVREIARAYHYVRTRNGRWLWIYYDEKRKQWFLNGEVN